MTKDNCIAKLKMLGWKQHSTNTLDMPRIKATNLFIRTDLHSNKSMMRTYDKVNGFVDRTYSQTMRWAIKQGS